VNRSCRKPLVIRERGVQFRDEQWQWQRALESCQKWKPQTSLPGNVIFWNLGPLHLTTALPYIAKRMQERAAVVLLQEVLIRKGTTVKVRRELRQMFPKFECYIATGSHVDIGNDENDRTLIGEYARSKAQITVVIFIHEFLELQTNKSKLTHWFDLVQTP